VKQRRYKAWRLRETEKWQDLLDRKGYFQKTQKGYFQKILQKFNINGDMKSVSTPLRPQFKLKTTISLTTVEECEYMYHVPYANTFGNLMYEMVCTRSDLSQAISMISRYIHDLGRGHWEQ